jgi:flavorubredoxin
MRHIIILICLALTQCDKYDCDYEIHYNARYQRYFVWTCNRALIDGNSYKTEEEAVAKVKQLRKDNDIHIDKTIRVPK